MATFYYNKFIRGISPNYYVNPVLGLTANAGTANLPKKIALSGKVALADGAYDCTGYAFDTQVHLYGSNRVFLKNVILLANNVIHIHNCNVDNLTGTALRYFYLYGCKISNSTFVSPTTIFSSNGENSIIENSIFSVSGSASIFSLVTMHNCTFMSTNVFNAGSAGIKSNVFNAGSISFRIAFTNTTNFQYNIISPSTLIAILGAVIDEVTDTDGTNYQPISYWEAQTGLTGMAAISAAYLTYFPTGYLSSSTNKVLDPLLVDPANGNYFLQSTSPAIGAGVSGVTCGALGIGKKINILADSHGYTDVVDNDTATNVTVTDDQIQADHNELNVMPGVGMFIANSKFANPSQIENLGIDYTDYGLYGEILDSLLSVSTDPISAGTALEDTIKYVVGGTSITYSAVVYAVGTIVTASGTGSFTGTGFLYKINDYPNYKTVNVRWKLTVPVIPIAAGTALTEGCWYEVITTVSYNGSSRVVGELFQCLTGITAFTSGSVNKIFDVDDPFYLFVLKEYPLFKRVGDVVDGAIDLTNGQLAYMDAANDARLDFTIICKYLQLQYYVQNGAVKTQ